ncbi:glycoside hydrolase family protein [Micromonospora chersina]|uniref:hypothetical protein n=1 Tax=Micromonospora chersina TaxID=47854 RepID=UPI0036C1B899
MTSAGRPNPVDLLTFDPRRGEVVLPPAEPGAGHWIGCPTVHHEAERGRFLMTYRQRRPRGAAADRGWRCAIATSTDGRAFTDIWSVHKDQLGTASMERFALTPDPAGGWLLYLSYVDPADNRWRIDVLRADEPDRFDIATRTAVLTADRTGTEGVKDPYPMWVDGVLHLYVSYAAAETIGADNRARAHADADVYVTGVTTFPTGLATSTDGASFDFRPDVLPVGAGWDRYQARITTVLTMPDGYLAYYDGSAAAAENYEETTGVAVSTDLATWRSLTPDGPLLVSPHASGSLRYADAVPVDDDIVVFYEYARPDGAHELRLNRLSGPAAASATR